MFPVTKGEDLYSVRVTSIEVSLHVYASNPVTKGQELTKAKLNYLMTKVKIEAPSTIRLVRGEELRLV